jgi:Flp pilus assembly protein TadG
MTALPFASSLARRFRGFAGDENGVSAIEFAMLLPLMITLYLGGVEITQAVSADRKATLVAHTIGDLVAQVSSVTDADITNILNAGTAVLYPFNTANLKMTVSSVMIDGTGRATVSWSKASSGATVRSGDVTASIPASLRQTCQAQQPCSLIWAESTYAYRPTLGYIITGTLNLSEKIYLRPRLSSCVSYPPTVPASSCP